MKSRRILQIINEGIFLSFVVVVLSVAIFYIAYDNLDESGITWYDNEKQEMVTNPPPEFQELLPFLLPLVILDIFLILMIYWLTLRKIEKRKLLEYEIEKEKNR